MLGAGEEKTVVMTAPPVAAPAAQRIEALDFVRGVALFGILLMNITGFGLPDAYTNPQNSGGAEGANLVAWIVTQIGFEGTQRALFSMLFGASVILTSHYMEDVVQLCPRVVVIDRGRLIYDGDLRALALRVRPDKRIVVRFADGAAPGELARFGQVVAAEPGRATLQVGAEEVSGAVARLLAALPVADLTVEDPPLEEVLSELFRASRLAATP